MKNKDFKESILNFVDGEASEEEKRLLEKECSGNPELAREKESLENIVSLLKHPDRIDSPPGFTEKVMKRISNRPVCLKRRIARWIISPLDLHINWTWKWSMVFSVVVLICAGLSWEHFRFQRLYTQVDYLEQQVSHLKNQPVATRFVFYSPTAKTVHLAGIFNDWQADDGSQLINTGTGGTWAITLMIKPGRYEYMFLVDGKEWVTDPGAMDFRSDGFGHKNSIVEVFQEI